MNHKILHRFVKDGITKNKKTVFPFLLAGTMIVVIYYILASLAFTPYIFHDGVEAFYGGQTLAMLLNISAQIVMIFSVIFMIYANRFVMKDRKREMGLYGILGLSKRNINSILILDMIVKAVICIGLGLIIGTFFNKLALLTLYKIIKQPVVSGLMIVPRAVIQIIIIFAIIFLICLIMNILSVNIANPAELLRSDRTGEKEPKVKVLMLLVGIVTLAAGYYVALTCKSTFDALSMFFVSVILVICGTYFLFITGSIFILKRLKSNKKFYYKTKNFVSVSNLIYRMKHNAAGLASICVLSTAVLILLTCASSLSLLGEKNIDKLYPNDIKIKTIDNREDDNLEDFYFDIMKKAADEANVTIEEGKFYRYMSSVWVRTDNQYTAVEDTLNLDFNAMDNVYLFTVDEYNRLSGKNITLKPNEVLAASSDYALSGKVVLFGKEFQIVNQLNHKDLSAVLDPSMALFKNVIFVFDSKETRFAVMSKDRYIGNPEYSQIYAGFNTNQDWTSEQIITFSDSVKRQFAEKLTSESDVLINENLDIGFKQEDRAFFYNIYGGVFFVGIFLAILFLMATVLIIYYKQMSEGFEDQKRYQILSYVGLTEEETKYTIKRQVMILFFLPVVTAIIHMTVASHIVKLFLQSIIIIDMFTYIMSMVIVAVAFVIVYIVVYKITSVQYYKIVNQQ